MEAVMACWEIEQSLQSLTGNPWYTLLLFQYFKFQLIFHVHMNHVFMGAWIFFHTLLEFSQLETSGHTIHHSWIHGMTINTQMFFLIYLLLLFPCILETGEIVSNNWREITTIKSFSEYITDFLARFDLFRTDNWNEKQIIFTSDVTN